MAQSGLKSRRRQDYGFTLEYRTRWSDNDVYGHMNNSIYYFFFDSVVNSYLATECAHSPTSSPHIGLVVHSHCDYFSPTGFPSVLDVAMRIKKLGKSSVTYEVAVFERGIEDVKAVGEFVHVYVERESRRPPTNGLAPEMRTAMEKLLHTQAKL